MKWAGESRAGLCNPRVASMAALPRRGQNRLIGMRSIAMREASGSMQFGRAVSGRDDEGDRLLAISGTRTRSCYVDRAEAMNLWASGLANDSSRVRG